MAAWMLTIPDLDEEMMARLRLRAIRHGRSIESEARAILTESITSHGSEPDTSEQSPPVSGEAQDHAAPLS